MPISLSRFSVCLPAAAALLLAAVWLHAGPLNPPGGPVVSTYKTLTDIEPRIAVNSVNTPSGLNAAYLISQPGSYYLTGNLTFSTMFGVYVNAPDVTLDLNGFSISGTGATPSIGVNCQGAGRITLRNGSISGVPTAIHLANDTVAEDLSLVLPTSTSYGMTGNDRCTIRRCRFRGPGTAASSPYPGLRVQDFYASGVAVGIVGGDDAEVERAHIDTATSFGIQVGARSRISDCTVSNCSALGISAGWNSTIERSTASNNGTDGIVGGDGMTITECTSANNGGRGIAVSNGCRVESCITRNNQAEGISVNYSCSVRNNTCNGDGAAAGNHGAIRILGESNRIEANHLTYADIGINLQAAGNTIVRNSFRGNVATINSGGGNDIATLGPASGATNPWANILN